MLKQLYPAATSPLCLQEAFVDYDAWVDYLKDVTQNSGFELLLAREPKLMAVALHRIPKEGPQPTEESP